MRDFRNVGSISRIVEPLTDGDRAWLVLVAGVAAYDWWAWASNRDTLSESYGRALDSRRRWPTLFVLGYLVGHLTRTIPSRYDPLRRFTQ